MAPTLLRAEVRCGIGTGTHRAYAQMCGGLFAELMLYLQIMAARVASRCNWAEHIEAQYSVLQERDTCNTVQHVATPYNIMHRLQTNTRCRAVPHNNALWRVQRVSLRRLPGA
jgi:hypothetical protein